MIDLLRQPAEEIVRVQNEMLQRQIGLCARGHSYYRQRWADAGIDPATIRTVDDLERLPLTRKADLMAEPERFRLSCPDLPLHERALWEVNYTTGSTGDPTPLYVTTHDYESYLFQARRVAEISGISDRDLLANLLPLAPAPMGAFLRAPANAYAAGAAVATALTGAPHGDFDIHRSLDDAVRLVERHRATILWGVTSFVRRVLIRAAELGADFTRVRMCAVTGEASSPAMRDDLRRRMREFGAANPIVFDRYGSTEAGGLAQCREEGDWHNPAPELLFHEIVDPETGRRIPDGERGALALTQLNRRGTVLIRFVVGDTVGLAHDRCPHCGRTGDRIVGPVVRTKDLLKVKGMLINPPVLLDAIAAIHEVQEFQVVLTRSDPSDPLSQDEMVVRVASAHSARDEVSSKVVAAAQAAVRVRPRVEFVSARELYDPILNPKPVRLKDLRN
jgi:phenylacetate-coenzyme A ligase PaaK-like adenylate-forming protein